MKLGLNVSFPLNYISGLAFADLMKHGRRWYKCDSQGREIQPLVEAAIEPNGWPLELSVSDIIGPNFKYRAGVYGLRVGMGSARLAGPGVVRKEGQTAAGSYWMLKGEGAVSIIADGAASSISLRYEADPIDAVFAGNFLDRLRELNPSTIRFLDWQNVRGIYPTPAEIPEGNPKGWCPLWAARPKARHARWAENIGVPLEVCAELTRAIGCEGWYHIPHAGQDPEVYAKGIQDVVLKFSASNASPTWEHTNEAWNDKNPAYHFLKVQPVPIDTPGGEQGRVAYAHGAGSAHLLPTVGRRVLMGSTASVSFARNAIAAMGDAARSLDAIGCAAYLPSRYGETPLEVIASMRSMLPELRGKVREHRALADELGVKLRCYEGGRGVHQPTDAAVAADTHPDMQPLYEDLFTMLRDERVDELCVYAFCQLPHKTDGCWNIFKDLLGDTPKAAAFRDWNARN